MTGTRGGAGHWTEICDAADIPLDRGVCALVDGVAVAVFRCSVDDALYAIGNHDPYSGASVLSRGLVGAVEHAGDLVPYVASPMRKHRFDLRTGAAIEDPNVSAGAWAIRSADGVVEVAVTGSSW